MENIKSYQEFITEKKSPFKKDTLSKYKKAYKQGKKIPFSVRASLIAQGLIPRKGGPKKGKRVKSPSYN